MGKLLLRMARNKNWVTRPNVTPDILNRTQPPMQCVRTSFLASFAVSAGKKNTTINSDNLALNVTYLILAQSKLASPPLANFRIDKIDPG